MAQTVYSTQFFNGNVPVGQSSTVNVPAGYKWVLRDIGSWQTPGSNTYVRVWNSRTGIIIVELGHQPTAYFSQWSGFQVLEAGQGLYATILTSACHLTISGYQLQLP